MHAFLWRNISFFYNNGINNIIIIFFWRWSYNSFTIKSYIQVLAMWSANQIASATIEFFYQLTILWPSFSHHIIFLSLRLRSYWRQTHLDPGLIRKFSTAKSSYKSKVKVCLPRITGQSVHAVLDPFFFKLNSILTRMYLSCNQIMYFL